MSRSSEFMASVGVFLAVGAGVGLAIEQHTDEVARGKANTAEACRNAYITKDRVTQQMQDCMENGWGGGRHINTHVPGIEIGAPVELVNGYIVEQRSEADHIELNRILEWGLLSGLVGVILLRDELEDNSEDDPFEFPEPMEFS